MEKLSQILMRERELLDTLLFRLETDQMVLASGRTRWLMRSAREVEQVLSTIRETEILRAVAADAVAASIGLEPNPSLRALAEAADEPWRTILGEHHAAFVTVTHEIGALDRPVFGGVTTTRTDAGTRQIRVENADLPNVIVDLRMQQTTLQTSMASTSRVMQPSLLDFLR